MELRDEVINHYSGGTMRCKRCGADKQLVLNAPQGMLPMRGQPSYLKLKKDGWPEGPTVMCRPCVNKERVATKERILGGTVEYRRQFYPHS